MQRMEDHHVLEVLSPSLRVVTRVLQVVVQDLTYSLHTTRHAQESPVFVSVLVLQSLLAFRIQPQLRTASPELLMTLPTVTSRTMY